MSSDEERFSALFADHYRAVMAYALRRSDPETAQDVAAETFVVAWRKLGEAPAEPRPWLLVIARHTLANHQRGQRRRLLHEAAAARHSPDAGSAGFDDAVSDRLALVGALDTLTDPDRELLMLVAWDGLTPAEAAAVLGCSAATARVRLHRARSRLLSAMTSPEPAPPAYAPGALAATAELRDRP